MARVYMVTEADVTDRRCGTCRYWLGEISAEARLCHWPAPLLPFWADLRDHDNWTYRDDGRRCRVWVQREFVGEKHTVLEASGRGHYVDPEPVKGVDGGGVRK